MLKQVRALNDPLIIEAINLFDAEVEGVINLLENQRAGSVPMGKFPVNLI